MRQAQNPDLSRIKQRGPILKLMQWCANKIGLRSDMPELNENLKLPILLVAAIWPELRHVEEKFKMADDEIVISA